MPPFDVHAWFRHPETRFGTLLSIDHSAVLEIAARSGWDWLWLDAEHGRFDERSAADACAITRGRVPTFVRVPDKSETTLKRYLDAGADGIIIPQVSSVAEVRAIAQAALFPPLGKRSVGIARAHGYGADFAEYLQHRSYALIVQIETVAGVDAVEAILQEPGVDAVVVGPYDLSGSCGRPGDIACEQVQGAISHVQVACRAASRPCGIFAADVNAATRYAKQGFQLVAAAIDTATLSRTYREMVQALHTAQPADVL